VLSVEDWVEIRRLHRAARRLAVVRPHRKNDATVPCQAARALRGEHICALPDPICSLPDPTERENRLGVTGTRGRAGRWLE
jgi:hypothetical protein